MTAATKPGLGKGWKENNIGHGPAFRFIDPDQHNVEIYYATEWYHPAAELKPALKNPASRYADRGVGLRCPAHINSLAADVKSTRVFFEDVLGGRLSKQIIFDDGSEKASWITFTNKSYDIAISEDLRAADICLEHGVFIETGPHKHAINQTFFLYVMNPAAIVLKLPTSARTSFSRPIGSRSFGIKPSARKDRRGACQPFQLFIRTAHRQLNKRKKEPTE